MLPPTAADPLLFHGTERRAKEERDIDPNGIFFLEKRFYLIAERITFPP